ncbi:MAG: EAL domain-containing protein [Gammaproteobacteria bacterium]|nr:EAL domain-containing protein [Gammaproteobacteria bacterium]
MKQTSNLLAKKQAQYLYQSLNLTVISLFFAISMFFYLFWELQQIQDQLINWYLANLFILALRIGVAGFYQRSSDKSNPQKWIYLFIFGSCLNGTLISFIIFLAPDNLDYYYTYVLLLVGTMAIASIATLGIVKKAFFAYIASLLVPLAIFFLTHSNELQSFHFYGYLIIFLFTSSAAIRINKSLISAFTMEIDNAILTKKLTQETDVRIVAEDELRDKALELQLLNENLECKIKEKTSELENLAFYDTLTQLPNRHHFYEYLSRTLTRNKITLEPFALFFIDLDEFKNINDTLGHDFGDELLIKVSSRLRDSTRVDDFIARISGDEFIVIIKGHLNENKIAEIADKIINTIAQPYTFSNAQTFISCSLGISLYPHDADSINALVKYADLAMYHAKENGKNAFHFYNNGLYEKKAKKFILATALKTAIKNNELYLVYQPQVCSQNAQVSSIEVLLRWNSSRFGPVPVDKFIPIAEETNQIVELEDFVLRTALQQVKFWNKQSDKQFRIAVNISTLHFRNKHFIKQIETILSQTDFNPELLELELTESALVKETQQSIEKLTYLKSLGLKISIDDFGTGYSSMSYLKQLPVDTLKIDKSFIDGIPDDPNNKAITKAIIVLAHQFHLETIAEGVEHQHQLDFLKEVGCHLVQGYYYYKPLTVDEFEKEFKLSTTAQ